MSTHNSGIILESLRELYNQYGTVMKDYRIKNNTVIAGLPCSFIPFEILAAAGITPAVIPAYMFRDSCRRGMGENDLFSDGIFDLLIFPDGCCNKPREGMDLPVSYFQIPRGYGDDTVMHWDRVIRELLRDIPVSGGQSINSECLLQSARDYDALRRRIRGITAAKNTGPSMVRYSDLLDLYEYAVSFPPGIIQGYLSDIHAIMHEARGSGPGRIVNAMIYSSIAPAREIIDAAEDEGCNIYRDDVCAGSRLFDVSYNTESDDLYREILFAFSFSPLCPCLRPAADRNDMMFAMAKKYGIDLVIFLEDLCCSGRRAQMCYTAARLMRSCVDVIITDSEKMTEDVKNYMAKAR